MPALHSAENPMTPESHLNQAAHRLVVEKCDAGLRTVLHDFRDERLADVVLINVSPWAWQQPAEPANLGRGMRIADDYARAEDRQKSPLVEDTQVLRTVPKHSPGHFLCALCKRERYSTLLILCNALMSGLLRLTDAQNEAKVWFRGKTRVLNLKDHPVQAL
jgi:hypothetical protein